MNGNSQTRQIPKMAWPAMQADALRAAWFRAGYKFLTANPDDAMA
jgi:hypothetical protein